MEIQTDRLTVRPLRRDDWRDLLDYLSLPETYAFESGKPVLAGDGGVSPYTYQLIAATVCETPGPPDRCGPHTRTKGAYPYAGPLGLSIRPIPRTGGPGPAWATNRATRNGHRPRRGWVPPPDVGPGAPPDDGALEVAEAEGRLHGVSPPFSMQGVMVIACAPWPAPRPDELPATCAAADYGPRLGGSSL